MNVNKCAKQNERKRAYLLHLLHGLLELPVRPAGEEELVEDLHLRAGTLAAESFHCLLVLLLASVDGGL